MSHYTRRDFFQFWRRLAPAAPAVADGETHAEAAAPAHPTAERDDGLPGYLRPPGALAEALFVATCDRSHECIKACPYEALLPLGEAYAAAQGTPVILPETHPCRLCSDLPCIAACPSGALAPTPLDEVSMGLARWSEENCILTHGDLCTACIAACPVSPVTLWTEGGRIVVDAERCTGCGMCVYACPTAPRSLTIG